MKLQPCFRPSERLLAAAASIALVSSLVGCSGFSTTATPASTAGVAFAGAVHGGQQPVSGAKIYLLGAATTGYGAVTRSLLLAGTGIQQNQYGSNYATTDANGNFGFTNFYCPTPTTQVYVLALGGNPGLGAGTNNSAIAAAASIGNCSNITTSTFLSINEVTTAAFVTAAQQFMTNSTSVGSSSTNTAGIATAFLLAQDLANSSTGAARTINVAGTGSVPQTKLNTLGNIIAPCINSASSTSSACTSLFSAVTPSGGTQPSDTIGALLLIAQNPGNNVSNINALSSASSPFQPSANVTTDFSIAITYSGGGMTAPGSVVIDSAGDAFVGNSPSTAGVSGTDSIVGFSPNGAILTGANGFTAGIHAPTGLAIDGAGNLWSTDLGNGNTTVDQIVKQSGSGALSFAFADGNVSNPQGIAIDSSNNAWVANQNNSKLIKVTAAGADTLQVTSTNFANPAGIGIDGSGNIFSAGTGSNTILKFNSAGTVLSPAGGYSVSGLSQPTGISIDASGNVSTINNKTSTITKITNSGTLIAPATPQPSISNAYVLAIDGGGGAWYANCRAACGDGSNNPDNLVHVLASQAQSTGQANGYVDPNLSRVGTAAIDSSGNVWVTNNGNGKVSEFIGLAMPVVTPLAVASANNKLGTRP